MSADLQSDGLTIYGKSDPKPVRAERSGHFKLETVSSTVSSTFTTSSSTTNFTVYGKYLGDGAGM